MKFICYILNLPWPKIKVRDVFVHENDEGNPYFTTKYKVSEIQKDWAKLQIGNEAFWHTDSIHLRDLRAFYIKINAN